ncbi:MAG: MFS transporter [Lachnospiraceae bacterium]|nr:MFS transporter [Lachnospiraceae bacterium]
MTERTGKKYGAAVKAATLCVALLMYTTSMTTPALAEIAKAFPDASGETVKLISSIPSLMLCIFSLVSGWMTTKISIKRSILVASALIFVGVFPAFFGGMGFIIATRVIFGAGYGLVFPLASAVVTDLFEGSTKDTMMGWKSAVGAAAGVVFQSLGGILTAYSWRYAFLGFLLVIPIVLIVLFVLPDTGVKTKVQTAEKKGDGKKFTSALFICGLVGFLLNAVQFSYMQNMAMFIAADEIGSALDAANVLSTFTAASFVAGLIYVGFAKIFKKFTPALAILLVGCAFGIAMNAKSLPMLFISAVVFGFGFGFTNPSLTLKAASGVTDGAYTPMAISIYVCCTGIGQFMSAYILRFLRNVSGMTEGRADWKIACVSIIAGAVIGLICLAVFGNKKEANV